MSDTKKIDEDNEWNSEERNVKHLTTVVEKDTIYSQN
jgi:hypothetical protein